jgi:zinc transporter ZupT
LEGAALSAPTQMRTEVRRKALIVGVLCATSFLVLYVACYFIVMHDNLKYFFVFKHALNSGPDYAPSIIVGLSILCFIGLWLIIALTLVIVWMVKRRRGRVGA